MAYNLNNLNYKTELCKSYQATLMCKYGQSCQFAHGAHELRKKPYVTMNMGMGAMNMGAMAGMGTMFPTTTPGVPTMMFPRNPQAEAKKYKTVLCRHFETTGTCQMGIACRFAHGQTELRQSTYAPQSTTDQNGTSVTTQGQTDEQRKGTKRPYDEGDGIYNLSTAENDEATNQLDSEQRVFGAVIDYLQAELMRKGLKDKADEFYQEVLSIINKYSAIVTSEGQTEADA